MKQQQIYDCINSYTHTKLVNWQHSFETGNVRVPYTYLPRAVTDIMPSTFHDWEWQVFAQKQEMICTWLAVAQYVTYIPRTLNRAILPWKAAQRLHLYHKKVHLHKLHKVA